MMRSRAVMSSEDNCGRGLKQLAFRHLPLFKHPFCRYCPDKHRCLKTGAYGTTVNRYYHIGANFQRVWFLWIWLKP